MTGKVIFLVKATLQISQLKELVSFTTSHDFCFLVCQTSSDPSQPGNFRPEVWKKTKQKKTLKNDLRVMKQILYDMGKKNIFFLITYRVSQKKRNIRFCVVLGLLLRP